MSSPDDDITDTRVFPEVVTGQGSPSRREFLRAIRATQSIERIPSRLERDEWHALSGRLEWSRGRGELVFRPEWEAAPPREPASLSRNRSGIDVASVLETMAVHEIDQEGLDRQEREILRYLLEVGRPIGLKAVAAALRMDARTIERVHEPYLIEKGFVIRTMRGRVATDKARAHLARPKVA